jgi:hypothetical protein
VGLLAVAENINLIVDVRVCMLVRSSSKMPFHLFISRSMEASDLVQVICEIFFYSGLWWFFGFEEVGASIFFNLGLIIVTLGVIWVFRKM